MTFLTAVSPRTVLTSVLTGNHERTSLKKIHGMRIKELSIVLQEQQKNVEGPMFLKHSMKASWVVEEPFLEITDFKGHPCSY